MSHDAWTEWWWALVPRMQGRDLPEGPARALLRDLTIDAAERVEWRRTAEYEKRCGLRFTAAGSTTGTLGAEIFVLQRRIRAALYRAAVASGVEERDAALALGYRTVGRACVAASLATPVRKGLAVPMLLALRARAQSRSRT